MDSDAVLDAWTRPQSAPLVGTASAASALARVKYSHDAMIDHMIENPSISQTQLAAMFGYTGAWVSRVVNSDAFLARLAERKGDLVDPAIALTLDEKFRSLAAQSLDVIQEKLSLTKNVETAMKALELSTKALGYGARQQNLNVQQNFVVAMPTKITTPEDWAAQHQHISQRSPKLAELVQQVTDVG